MALEIATPEWAVPLLVPSRYKGAKGGRGSGKSHFFAELAVEAMVCDPSLRVVCIREVQRSLKFSVKSLVEQKIRALDVVEQFTILDTEVRRNGGTGIMIFEGMQNHTADSIKSLEGFGIAWVEEAQSLSRRSLQLLIPTIRREGSELWFSWNPDEPSDAVDQLLVANTPDDAVVVHVNYLDNPFCPEVLRVEARWAAKVDPDAHGHVWLGLYNLKSNAKILQGKWLIDEFEPVTEASLIAQHGKDYPDDPPKCLHNPVIRAQLWQGPYHGADFGFAQDPNTLIRCWIAPGTTPVSTGRLMIEYEAYKVSQDTDDIPTAWKREVPGCEQYTIRGDSARPETISYLSRHGFPQIAGVEKWAGSVEDGIAYLRQFEQIVIHPRCVHVADEARLYSYKVDPRTGDVMPVIVDAHNHTIDAIRYALAPLIRHPDTGMIDYYASQVAAMTARQEAEAHGTT
jgi:phage terminase large subunit